MIHPIYYTTLKLIYFKLANLLRNQRIYAENDKEALRGKDARKSARTAPATRPVQTAAGAVPETAVPERPSADEGTECRG